MARIDEVEYERRKIAGRRLFALFERARKAHRGQKELTKSAFAEDQLLVNQGRFGRMIDPSDKDYGVFDVRVALRMSAIEARLLKRPGRSVDWWLALDAVIEQWPDEKERGWLRAAHPGSSGVRNDGHK